MHLDGEVLVGLLVLDELAAILEIGAIISVRVVNIFDTLRRRCRFVIVAHDCGSPTSTAAAADD